MLCLEPAACGAAFLSPSLYLDLSLPIPGGRIVAVSPTSRGRTAPKTGLCGALWAVIKHSGPGNRRIRPFSCMPSLKNHRLLHNCHIRLNYQKTTVKTTFVGSPDQREACVMNGTTCVESAASGALRNLTHIKAFIQLDFLFTRV